MSHDATERLQKILAHAGVASRRKAEQLIGEGRVSVNSRVVTQLGTKVNPALDDIRVDGQKVKLSGHYVYILLNKPRGVVSTMEDPRGRRALGDLVKVPQRVFPVGRLDATSEGLVLLTDDGELANLLTHPRYEHEKEYRVLVGGTPSDETLDAWRRGIMLEGERTAPAGVDLLRRDKDSTLLRVTLHEGRKRQIREVGALLGHPVRQLERVRLGPLRLGALKPGEWRHLNEREVEELTAAKRQEAKVKKVTRKTPAPLSATAQDGAPAPGHQAGKGPRPRRKLSPPPAPRARAGDEGAVSRKPPGGRRRRGSRDRRPEAAGRKTERRDKGRK